MRQALLWTAICILLLGQVHAERTVVGDIESVRILGPAGEQIVLAKIDTGADSSSIDAGLAERLGIAPLSGQTRVVETATGSEQRPVVRLRYMLGQRVIDTEATLADRGGLSTPMIVGKRDLQDVLVDPGRTGLTRPAEAPGTLAAQLSAVLAGDAARTLLIIPILASFIILFRILLGVQTYGVFGPLVIALSIIEAGIIHGMVLYALLLAGGIGFTLLIRPLRYPLICEIALLMFFLGTVTILLTTYGNAAVTRILFPLIITSFLIERFSQSLETHEAGKALGLLATTLLVAAIMGAAATLLLEAPLSLLWVCVVGSLIMVIALSHYVGLRLTELLRFKVLEER